MSPEQAQGVPDVDGRTDLYSLGVVLFECLAGRPPFSSPSAAAVLDMHQHNPAPDLHSLRRDVPAKLAAAVTRALAKSRAERWQRAGAKPRARTPQPCQRSEEHTSELQSPCNLVCRLLLEKKKNEPTIQKA